MLRQGIGLCSVLLIAACMKKASETPAPETRSTYSAPDTMPKAEADTKSAAADATFNAPPEDTSSEDTSSTEADRSLSDTPSDASASSAVGVDLHGPVKVDPALADRGKRIWKSKQCSGCHELGRTQSTGPDLVGATDRRTAEWLERWLQDPVVMTQIDDTAKALKKQFNAQMPKLGLSKDDADALISYLAQETQQRRK